MRYTVRHTVLLATAMFATAMFATLLPAALRAQPREIAKITVFPAARTMTAGDTLRLTAEARDAAGAVIPGVTFRYRLGPSARFEGSVDSTGLVTAGATAILPVTVTATLPGARPKFEIIELTAVPGPAASIEVTPGTATLVAGQTLRATARVLSATGDRRSDRVTWTSSTPAVATISPAGLLTAKKAGTTTISASVGAASITTGTKTVTKTATITVAPGGGPPRGPTPPPPPPPPPHPPPPTHNSHHDREYLGCLCGGTRMIR